MGEREPEGGQEAPFGPPGGAAGEVAPATWDDLEAAARIDLGLAEGEFGRRTPREFAALVDRWFLRWEREEALEEARARRADLRAGIVAAVVANCHRKKGARAFQAEDFMPKVKQVDRAEGARPAKTEAEVRKQMAVARVLMEMAASG